MSMGGGRMAAGRMGRGPMGRGGMAPAARTKDLSGTLRRLVGRLRPEMVKLVISLLLGVISVGFIITGPKILGTATNILFNGVVSAKLPAGVTQQQAEAMLRLRGQGQLADMLSGMNLTPGEGVDLNALGRVPAWPPWSTCSARPSTSVRASCWPGLPSAPCTACAGTSNRSWAGCPCSTSTATRTATS